LIYLDPPFNSQANYNVLFKSPSGKAADAQIEAFEDTWHWGERAERAFADVLASPATQAAELLRAMRSFSRRERHDGLSDDDGGTADRIAPRLKANRLALPALRPDCEPLFKNPVGWHIWAGSLSERNRLAAEHAERSRFTRFPSAHDSLLSYGRSDQVSWNAQFLPHRSDYIQSHYGNVEHQTGRRYMLDNCLNPNPDRPNLTYEWKGVTRVWRWTKEKMQALEDEGRLIYTRSGMPRYKRYLDEMAGTPLTSVWTDIPPINSQAQERLGYPTQKPVALLERIIGASSNAGDIVLDPFCGCGTTIHAAQKLGRAWIGIDITHLAISLIERRLKDAFPGIAFEVHGTPKDLESAVDLASRDKYQFQWWAVSLVDARPYGGKKKGADGGIDGILFFAATRTRGKRH
jgi:site-specific DNA-methyltransferase (adenine-specific)